MRLKHNLFASAIAVAIVGIGLVGCSSSDDPAPPPPAPVEPGPTEYELGKAAIEEAETPEAAQEAYDAVNLDAVSGQETNMLRDALAEKLMMLADAEAAETRQGLVTAAMCTAATQECVAAHRALVAALEADLAALEASDDATNADEKAAEGALQTAKMNLSSVEMALRDSNRDTATGMAVDAAKTEAEKLEAEPSEENIAAAEKAIMAAKEEIAKGDDPDAYGDVIGEAEMAVARAKERNMVSAAIMAARNAGDGLAEDSSAAAVSAAQSLLNAATKLVDDADHLNDAEKRAYRATITDLQRPVTVAKNRNDADDKAESERKGKAEREEERKRNEAMAATAAKLYAGISEPTGDATSPGANDRAAAYNTAGTAVMVSVGDGTNTPTPVTLSEDKKASVTKLHGWEGKRYADPAGGDMYEAIVYSNVADPTPGDKFGQIGVTTAVQGYEYGLDAEGQATINTSSRSGFVNLVAGPRFDHGVGVKRFPLPDPNDSAATRVPVPGTFHGVSGTYFCTPGPAVCAANVSDDGFQLGTVPSATDATFTDGGGAWVFKPANPEDRVLDAVDTMYASYGWWILKRENDGAFTASAFVDEKGTVAAASGLDALNGTATYMGGAAGKYALASSTGGTNDAGHFTARAKLEADFTNNDDPAAITGTLDMFRGADDQMRDWEVQLKGSAIGDTGLIGNDGTSTTSPGGTVWTIGDKAAEADGNWTGALRNNGADGVPQVATGTFYSTYDTAGKMIGSFGANKQ